jgi:glycosyltransferase involved in cell wall biosynthesis
MAKIKKTIGIDARFYGPIGKGLGRYTQELVDYVVEQDAKHDYVIFLGRHNFADFEADGKRVKKVLADLPWYGWAEQVILPRLIAKHQIDLMHFPHFNVPIFCPTRFVVTIHDLILTKYPTVRASTLGAARYWLKNLLYRLVIWRAVKRASQVIAVSEFTKQDVVSHFKLAPEKVVVTYEGVAALESVKGLSESNQQVKITKKYLLYVGNAYPHKNLEWLLRVTKGWLKRQDMQLVLVGKQDYFYRRLAGLTESWNKVDRERIVFAGFVSDEVLVDLYAGAWAYVFPSLYEGFGLPPLEAMAQSCPVLAASSSSMPEILGEAALYFDPEQGEQLLAQLNHLLKESGLRKSLVAAGLQQVKLYDWATCGQKTLEVYQKYAL